MILNCIRSFIAESANNEDYYSMIELCYIYLLRLFVTDPRSRIQDYPNQTTELLHFLFESLFSPSYSQSAPGASAAYGQLVSLEIHNQDMALIDYVQSLFALLCYNCMYW